MKLSIWQKREHLLPLIYWCRVDSIWSVTNGFPVDIKFDHGVECSSIFKCDDKSDEIVLLDGNSIFSFDEFNNDEHDEDMNE